MESSLRCERLALPFCMVTFFPCFVFLLIFYAYTLGRVFYEKKKIQYFNVRIFAIISKYRNGHLEENVPMNVCLRDQLDIVGHII